MEVDLYGHKIDLGPSPSKLCYRRWMGYLSPEPETVAWIESLPQNQGKVFFDIGASVGTHAIRAALRGLSVTAFEPYEPVYLELYSTIQRNNLPIVCSRYALSDSICDNGRLARGRSTCTFYTNSAVDGQVAEATTLDAWCSQHTPPDYIKLDVDGNEEQIIAGGVRTLEKVQSILIEVDPVVNPNIPKIMADLGFRYDDQQVKSCIITDGKYKGTANYIFFK